MRLAVSIARSPAAAGKIPAPVIERLEADVRVLQGELASRKLKEAMEAQRTGEAIKLIDELISLEPDAAERQKWQEMRQQLERQLPKRQVGLWPIVAALLIFAVFGWAIAPGPNSATPYSPQPSPMPPSATPPAGPATPTARETQPAPGTAALTRAELRWCLYREERIEGARARLERLIPRLQRSEAQYNALLLAFSARTSGLSSPPA
jgi:tetratricopeptide (TPR) repeat protein